MYCASSQHEQRQWTSPLCGWNIIFHLILTDYSVKYITVCRRGNQDSERLNNLSSVVFSGRTKIQSRSVSKIHAVSHFCCIFIRLPRVGSFLSNAASCLTRNPAHRGCLVVLPGSCRAGLKVLGHRCPPQRVPEVGNPVFVNLFLLPGRVPQLHFPSHIPPSPQPGRTASQKIRVPISSGFPKRSFLV